LAREQVEDTLRSHPRVRAVAPVHLSGCTDNLIGMLESHRQQVSS
jgi:hypothetical protein